MEDLKRLITAGSFIMTAAIKRSMPSHSRHT